MNQRLAVLVTGGASVIGRATVERFLSGRWDVLAADLNAENGERLVDSLEVQGYQGHIGFIKTDVSVEDDVAAAVAMVRERYGRLDCMVNNAGVGGAFGPITQIEVE